jgi:hypothetical protein
MAKLWAKVATLSFLALLALGADAARADGFRFGFGLGLGLGRFGGPHFGGPRYDGPRDVDPGPPPDERGRLAAPEPPGPRSCYTPSETRERVVVQKLREPFELMRKAAAMTQAEALTGKLCRWREQDIYEITLLRADGRVIHVFLNAATGAVVGALNTH